LLQTADVILVIETDRQLGVEFQAVIDSIGGPPVCIATPRNWRELLGDTPIAAVVVAGSPGRADTSTALAEIVTYSPGVPIVVIGHDARAFQNMKSALYAIGVTEVPGGSIA